LSILEAYGKLIIKEVPTLDIIGTF